MVLRPHDVKIQGQWDIHQEKQLGILNWIKGRKGVAYQSLSVSLSFCVSFFLSLYFLIHTQCDQLPHTPETITFPTTMDHTLKLWTKKGGYTLPEKENKQKPLPFLRGCGVFDTMARKVTILTTLIWFVDQHWESNYSQPPSTDLCACSANSGWLFSSQHLKHLQRLPCTQASFYSSQQWSTSQPTELSEFLSSCSVFKELVLKPDMIMHTCNLQHSGGWGWWSKGKPGYLVKPCHKNVTETKPKTLTCLSSLPGFYS